MGKTCNDIPSTRPCKISLDSPIVKRIFTDEVNNEFKQTSGQKLSNTKRSFHNTYPSTNENIRPGTAKNLRDHGEYNSFNVIPRKVGNRKNTPNLANEQIKSEEIASENKRSSLPYPSKKITKENYSKSTKIQSGLDSNECLEEIVKSSSSYKFE